MLLSPVWLKNVCIPNPITHHDGEGVEAYLRVF